MSANFCGNYSFTSFLNEMAFRYPDKLEEDTLRVARIGCDIVVFMVFNDFSTGQNQAGHKYSGFSGIN